MKNIQDNFATVSEAQMSTVCIVCQKPLADGQWFCRLPQKANGVADPQATKILLCSTSCALRYFANVEIETTTNH